MVTMTVHNTDGVKWCTDSGVIRNRGKEAATWQLGTEAVTSSYRHGP